MTLKYYHCRHCSKNICLVGDDMKTPTTCCGEVMKELIPNTTDGAHEKHVPVMKFDSRVAEITVGETFHPMTHDHYIQWIALATDRNVYTRYLDPGEVPKAYFALQPGEQPLKAFAYCNLHGLWSTN